MTDLRNLLLVILGALVLSACSPANACRSYGFVEGTVAFSQCLQNEVLAYQNRMARKP